MEEFVLVLKEIIQKKGWVLLFFCFLFYRGIKSLVPGDVHVIKSCINTLGLFIVSLHTLLVEMPRGYFSLSYWLGAVCMGSCIGYVLSQELEAVVQKNKYVIVWPGSWFNLCLTFIVFGAKAFFGFELLTDPHMIDQTWFEHAILLASGGCVGLSVGQSFCFFVSLKRIS